MRLFARSLKAGTFARRDEQKKQLIIQARMPVGGTAAQVNEKVIPLEN